MKFQIFKTWLMTIFSGFALACIAATIFLAPILMDETEITEFWRSFFTNF